MDASRAFLHHALRSGFGRQLIVLCDELLKQRGYDASLVFWRAFGYAREGNFSAAIRDAESLRGRRDADYAALIALSMYYQCQLDKMEDARGALALVEAQLLGAIGSASSAALVLSAHFRWLLGEAAAARGTLERVLSGNPNHEAALCLLGWVHLSDGPSTFGWGLSHCLGNGSRRSSGGGGSSSGERRDSGTPRDAFLLTGGAPNPKSASVGDAGGSAISVFESVLATTTSESGATYATQQQSAGPRGLRLTASSNADAILGLGRALMRRGDPSTAIDILSLAITALSSSSGSSSDDNYGGDDNPHSSHSLPSTADTFGGGGGGTRPSGTSPYVSQLISVLLIERANALVRCGGWALALDSGVLPVLATDPTHIPALALALCIAQQRNGPGAIVTLNGLQALAGALQEQEPHTPALWHHVSASAARLCLRCTPALAVTLSLARAAAASAPDCSGFVEEVGWQRLNYRDAGGAAGAFKDAASLDEGNAGAVVGGIAAQLALGMLEDADAQLEMFRLVVGAA